VGEGRSVLVTGASGFIGRATVTALEKAAWDVTRALRCAEKSKDAKAIFLDLTKPSTILSLADKMRFDAIVHIGAHIGWSGESLAELYVPNVLSTGCLAALSRRWGAHLLFASAAIVSGIRTQKIETTSPSNPDTPYAKSKWLAEELILASECSHCIFRIAGVFGLHGPKHLGINRAIDGAINGLAPTQVGGAAALRNYIYVKDVADSIVFALENKLQGTHLVSGSKVLSIQQMLSQICEIFLPGQLAKIKDGEEAVSQVICPSQYLPTTRKFIEALADMKSMTK
jgi:nucleoside-diphosphate-sugar epimerase